MKRILLVMFCILAVTLSGCSIPGKFTDEFDYAMAFAEDFCVALANDDIEKAKEYLYPTYSTPKKEDLNQYIEKIEEFNEIDFSEGITITNRTTNGWTMGGVYPGTTYYFVLEMLVGKVEVKLFFKVTKIESEYGIFSFGIEP